MTDRVLCVTAFKVVEFSMLYLMRPYCHPTERFKDQLIENIQQLGLPEAIENNILARTILSFRATQEQRAQLLNGALDIIEGTLVAIAKGEL